MRINSLTTSYADIGRLLDALPALCGKAPESLTAIPRAHQRLSTAASVTNPQRPLVQAALDDDTDDKAIEAHFETAAIARLVAEERRGSTQLVEAELLRVFCGRLESGAGDEVLSLLRKPFDAAASTLRKALAIVDIPNDPQAFIETASPAQLTAWQSVKPAVARLDRIAAAARIFGPNGAFPLVPDPRATDPGLECGWLDARAVMCAGGDLLAACLAFQRPNPDVRTSPWLRGRSTPAHGRLGGRAAPVLGRE